jgi:oligopeptidase A
MNPLLDFSSLPRFSEVKPEHVTPAVDTLLGECRNTVAEVADASTPAEWKSFVLPLENVSERLSRAWGQVAHLNAVMNSPELRTVYNENLPKITQYYSELSQNVALFEKYKALRASPEFADLDRARKKIVENELRDFRLGGAELSPEKKTRFMAVQEELAKLSAKFEENVLDATNAFSLVIENREQLSGIPADVLQAAENAARHEQKTGWKFTLHAPSYLPVMQYANNRELREQMYRAFATRASEFGNAEWDNAPLIARILELRREKAQLLGFANFAEVSLAKKMADTPQEVMAFLRELAAKAKPFAVRDYNELAEFASEHLGLSKMEPWDIAYVSEKLRVARYAFSDQEVKQYFPEPRVLSGLFQLVETLYGLRIEREQASAWHPDVKFFRISDSSGSVIGKFYLDLYARPSKRGGAWMDEAISRRRKDGAIQTPVAYLTCNFSAPVGDTPALFTHDEVITLFHEFGHGLHHLLTQVEELGVSGINGVEWDAVELPSQFMENFCWEWQVIEPMSEHVRTEARLPRELFDKMLRAKNFLTGMMTVRQLEFALFDLILHSDFDPKGNVLDLLDRVRREVAVVIPPEYHRFPNSFSHIFAGGYAAGYYSYKWAEVLSADAYSLFEEMGVLNEQAGKKFWNEVLAVGGSREALQSFIAFRGREPQIEALLRHNGMGDYR